MRYLPFLYSDLYWGVQLRGHHHPLEALAPSFFVQRLAIQHVCVSVCQRTLLDWLVLMRCTTTSPALIFLFNYYPNPKSIFIVFLFHAAKVRRNLITRN